MANRLETFRMLRDTYVTEIAKTYDNERHINGEIAELEAQLRIKRLARDETLAERATSVEQLAGIRAVIRGMEDRNTIEKRRLEDNTIAANRAIEDTEHGDV